MTDLPRPTEIEQKAALDWLSYSLRQGDVISPEALKVVREREGNSYVLAPDTADPARLLDLEHGVIGTGPGAAREALAKVLDGLAESGAACLVVEDELRSRKDPKPDVDGLPTAFVGERVIHWSGLASGVQEAIHALHRGSHGYPLNAFVTSVAEQDLGLSNGADLEDHDVASAVVQSLVAVIVAAYDADSFLIWEPI